MDSMVERRNAMRDLSETEVAMVDGGVLAYDLGFALGNAVGNAFRTGMEYVMNEPFRRQY